MENITIIDTSINQIKIYQASYNMQMLSPYHRLESSRTKNLFKNKELKLSKIATTTTTTVKSNK